MQELWKHKRYWCQSLQVHGQWVDYYLGAYNGAGQNYTDATADMGLGGYFVAKPFYKIPNWANLKQAAVIIDKILTIQQTLHNMKHKLGVHHWLIKSKKLA